MPLENASALEQPRRFDAFSRLRFPLAQVAVYTVLSLTLRIILVLKFRPDSAAQGLPDGAVPAVALSSWLQVFGTGILLDLAVAMILFLPCALWLAIWPERWISAKWQRAVFLVA